MQGVVALAIMLFSILASNTVAATIFVPLAINAAQVFRIQPTPVALLSAASAGIDFMLPVGTPPNAIAYATGLVTMPEMIRTGALMDVVSLLVVLFFALALWPSILVDDAAIAGPSYFAGANATAR